MSKFIQIKTSNNVIDTDYLVGCSFIDIEEDFDEESSVSNLLQKINITDLNFTESRPLTKYFQSFNIISRAFTSQNTKDDNKMCFLLENKENLKAILSIKSWEKFSDKIYDNNNGTIRKFSEKIVRKKRKHNDTY